METINHLAADPIGQHGSDIWADTPDWGSLRARCAATYRAQVARNAAGSRNAVRTGAFAIWARPAVHPAQTSRIVNPTGLADFKSAAGMKDDYADLRQAGGQGYL